MTSSLQASSTGMASQQGGPPSPLKLQVTQQSTISAGNSKEHSSPPVSATPQRVQDQASPSASQYQRRTPTQFQQRPGSSASSRLMRKGSRSSLGSSPVGNDDTKKGLTPKRSISNLITELRGAQASMESIPEPIVWTAPQIAKDCFEKELDRHHEASASTLVILHDACYGHRFSRPKTTKGTLSMIVERPERLLASVLGVATAYVRLGGFHSGARNAPHPKHASKSSPPFKIRRTNRALDIKSPYITSIHGTEWMSELHTLCETAQMKLAAGEKEVSRTESVTGEEKRTLHEGDLYLCQQSLDAFQGALGGVADAVDAVFLPSMDTKRTFVAVRPPGHHCSADYPSGFCWINNVHVGIEYAAQTYNLTHAAIIDFDLHHGDGSQSIAWDRNSKNNYRRLYAKGNAKLKLNPDIGYYSLHDINSYPCEMGDDEKVQAASLCVHNAHGQSIWNVHLQSWRTLDEFWTLYETRYKVLLDKASEFLKHHTARIIAEGKQRPRSAVFISAGFDASEWEGEGMQRHKVNVPTEFYARFTRDILKLAEDPSTGCDGRVVSVLEGGYSDRALCSSTLSHLAALCVDMPSNQEKEQRSGLGMSMQPDRLSPGLDAKMNGLSLSHEQRDVYDVEWWSAENLTALEHHVNPPPLSAGGKKMRSGPQPTYATPTESFAYKVIDPAKFARSVSGTMREGSISVRPITPPPPEVNWIVAAHELSKLLIPTHRSTTSCTPEELAGPKVKKERHSDIGVAAPSEEVMNGRQLRTRGKNEIDQALDKRKISNSDRRKTMADVPSLLAETDTIPVPARRASRRSSLASTTSNAPTVQDSELPPVPAIPQSTVTTKPMPMSRTPSAGNVQVKKMRPPSVAIPTQSKKAQSSNNRPSSAHSQINVPAPSRSPRKAITPATPTSTTTNDNGVDALASGMKRITLKVSSREENDKRAKEKLDADRRARALKGAETRRINKAAREAKASEEQHNVADVLARSSVPTTPSMLQDLPVDTIAPNLTTPLQNGAINHAIEPPLPASAHLQQQSQVTTQQIQPDRNLGANAVVNNIPTQYSASYNPLYQPPLQSYNTNHAQSYHAAGTQPSPASMAFNLPMTQIPMNEHQPFAINPGQLQPQKLSNAMPLEQLPQFTSTSFIPFAPTSAVPSSTNISQNWNGSNGQAPHDPRTASVAPFDERSKEHNPM